MERLGILGGSFDPPHIGHLAVAQAALYELELDKVLFIPCGNPPHKEKDDMTAAAIRLAMTETAIRANSKFEVNDIEIVSPEPSYTAITLEKLKKQLPDTELVFIVGADSLAYMKRWWKPEQIFALCKVAVAVRADTSEEELRKAEEECRKLFRARIRRLHMPILDISSSEIRASGNVERFRYFLEPNTLDYIKKHNLYEGA